MRGSRIGYGERCRECDAQMDRFTHPKNWQPRSGQPFYYAYWDICSDCRIIVHYEMATRSAARPLPDRDSIPVISFQPKYSELSKVLFKSEFSLAADEACLSGYCEDKDVARMFNLPIDEVDERFYYLHNVYKRRGARFSYKMDELIYFKKYNDKELAEICGVTLKQLKYHQKVMFGKHRELYKSWFGPSKPHLKLVT